MRHEDPQKEKVNKPIYMASLDRRSNSGKSICNFNSYQFGSNIFSHQAFRCENDPAVKSKCHPTRRALLDTATALLAENAPESITVDLILTGSGISKGSLYHHFEDFSDLIEVAMVDMFVKSVDMNIASIENIVRTATCLDDLVAGLRAVTQETQGNEMRSVRFRRARLLSQADSRPRLMAKMSTEQERLTATYTDLFATCQKRGWFNTDFDPQAAAVFIQAYTLGKIVDDVAPTPMDSVAWDALIGLILERVFTSATQPVPR